MHRPLDLDSLSFDTTDVVHAEATPNELVPRLQSADFVYLVADPAPDAVSAAVAVLSHLDDLGVRTRFTTVLTQERATSTIVSTPADLVLTFGVTPPTNLPSADQPVFDSGDITAPQYSSDDTDQSSPDGLDDDTDADDGSDDGMSASAFMDGGVLSGSDNPTVVAAFTGVDPPLTVQVVRVLHALSRAVGGPEPQYHLFAAANRASPVYWQDRSLWADTFEWLCNHADSVTDLHGGPARASQVLTDIQHSAVFWGSFTKDSGVATEIKQQARFTFGLPSESEIDRFHSLVVDSLPTDTHSKTEIPAPVEARFCDAVYFSNGTHEYPTVCGASDIIVALAELAPTALVDLFDRTETHGTVVDRWKSATSTLYDALASASVTETDQYLEVTTDNPGVTDHVARLAGWYLTSDASDTTAPQPVVVDAGTVVVYRGPDAAAIRDCDTDAVAVGGRGPIARLRETATGETTPRKVIDSVLAENA